MTEVRLDRERLERLMKGASVMGTGGGGSFSRGRSIIDGLERAGLWPRMIAVEDLPAGGLGITTAMLGGGLTNEAVEALEALAPAPPSVAAARTLAEFLGRPIGFVFAAELGPQNTLEAVRLAAHLDVPIVDGDCAGRAVPELHQTTLSLLGIPLTPFVLAPFQGDVAIIARVADDERGEALCRAVASASGGLVSLTGFPVDGEAMRKALIPGTLTACMDLGACIGPERFPAAELAQRLGGRVAFRGQVAEAEIRLQGGFFRGDLWLEGLGPFEGSRYRVGIQNEFMWAWHEDRLDIRCPDLVCVVASESGLGKVTYGHGFENALAIGEDLTVLHAPCAPPWRTAEGLRRFPDPDPRQG